ncbi:MAG: DUF362 domain-containing protein [Gemmataceae bacterium]
MKHKQVVAAWSRRAWLGATFGGAAAGVAGTLLAQRYASLLLPQPWMAPEESTRRAGLQPRDTMPGRYPGRVIEVRHPGSVTPTNVIQRPAVSAMVDRGMAELTGYEVGDLQAWASLFERDDVVGIKVNPVGRKPKKGEPGRVANAVGSISSFELVVKVVRSLQARGIPARNIIIFDRYANEFCEAGYKDLVERELPGVRWLCAALSYSNDQLDIRGRDPDCLPAAPEVERHVVGYDPDCFVSMGFAMPQHSPRDDRRFRSHLTLIVSRLISKMITLPVLKDHRSAGVTLALKNMSHGLNNNVCRSHLSGIAHGMQAEADRVLGPNQCNTFIPQAVAQQRLREKATLHLLDGLIGVYEGGPGNWNRTWSTWRHRGLLFATDPVALDHVGWDLIDARRAEEGWAPVARMGLLYQTTATAPTSATSPLAAATPLEASSLALATQIHMSGRISEAFNVRQPDHVILAGQLKLGVFERERLHYSQTILPADAGFAKK